MRDMSSVGFWIQIIDLAANSPWLLVMLVGGIGCLRRLQDRPREGWLVGGAIILALFARFGIYRLVALAGASGLMPTGNAVNLRMAYLLMTDVPNAIVSSVVWGLILYAAFGEGSGPQTKYLIEDEREAI